MLSLDAVDKYARTLAGVTVARSKGHRAGCRSWMIGEKVFVWERPFSKADLRRFGDDPIPQGDILAARVANLDEKDAILAIAPPGVFTIPHFNGYAAILIELRRARAADVRRIILDAWRTVAPAAKPARAKRISTRRARR